MRDLPIIGCALLTSCGAVSGSGEALLDRGPVANGVVKRSTAVTITVPQGVRTEGFDDDPRTFSDDTGLLIRGDDFRVLIDFSDRSADGGSGTAIALAGRQARFVKAKSEDGSESAQVIFPSSSSTSGTTPPIIEWQCARRQACVTAERIVSSIQVSWQKLEGNSPPPHAPPGERRDDSKSPPPAKVPG